MIPEQFRQQAQRRIQHAEFTMNEAAQLDALAARLMAVQRQWSHPDRETQLAHALSVSRGVWQGIQDALAQGALNLPLEARQNLLILSVYADSKTDACALNPSTDMLGSLIALTRTLAGSLKEWRVAA